MKPLLDEEKIEGTKEFYMKIHNVEMEYLEYWKENTLWHWEYWLSVFLTLFPWVLWIMFRKRGSEARLLLAGSIVIIISSWLDFLGVILGLWHYTGKALPTIPTYVPWDITLLPVTIMFWLQYKPDANPFLKAIIFAGMTAFIGEPLFKWLGLYATDHWKAIYSFPIYIVIYLIVYRISIAKTFEPLAAKK
ncbi:CBO0543 family protein [Ornithinibacillus sp. 179-J 7C1 HS]|uniref:CBO0543 family protein n=1 Tax=Ornithinibacillus sp. 179-J 7C1 HS TaxID=3142384 RepID=UPI0039A205F4